MLLQTKEQSRVDARNEVEIDIRSSINEFMQSLKHPGLSVQSVNQLISNLEVCRHYLQQIEQG